MSSELETTNVEGKSRKRLTPLLRKLLNDNIIPDLCWRDRMRQIWQMPWKHHKQTKWGDHDALMLRELAKVMYNYDGAVEPAPERLKHWKELLRNALRSLKDVKELKEQHVTDGERPYKVYQFVDNEVEVQKTRRGRGATAWQSRSIEKFRSNFHESSSPTCSSKLYQHVSDHSVQPLSNLTQVPACGLVVQGNSTQAVNVESASKEGHNAHSHCQLESSPLAGSEVTDTLLGDLTDGVDDNILNKLMSEFSLGNFRSRSPLRHDNEADNDMDIHEVSVKDVEIFNNGTLNTVGMDNRTSATTVNSPPKRSPFDRSQQWTGANGFTEVTLQNLLENDEGNNLHYAESHDVPGVTLHRLQQVDDTATNQATPASCFQNTPVKNQNDAVRDEILSRINSSCFVGSILNNNTLLSCPTNQQSYPSISSILSNAPAASVLVVVYYSMCHVVKWQLVTRKCRICFLPDHASRESMMTCTDPNKFGPADVELFELPEIIKDTGLSLEERDTNKVLWNLKRGLIVDHRDNKIYATRYCKAVPHFCNPGRTAFTKMDRLQEVKIFDLHDYLRHSVGSQYRYQTADPHVRLSFAVKDANKKVSALSLDIWLTDAYQARLQMAENAHSLEADCSLSDEYDCRVELEQLLKMSLQF